MQVDQNTLLAQYRGWLCAVAAGLVQDSQQREELAQEGWIAMWRAAQVFDESKGALPAWLTQHALWRMRDRSRDQRWTGRPDRRMGRSPVVGVVEYPRSDHLLWESLEAVDAMEGVMWAYHRGAILDAISRLTPGQRKYVYLRFWCGFRGPDMVAAFGYDPHGLWSSPTNGARKKLRASLYRLADR
jgi:RNA polymerase sigma factor (sigma-70 family)